MNAYQDIITIDPGKRGGKPCIRGMRITVGDVLGWLAAGMTHEEILTDFPELTETDIRACLAWIEGMTTRFGNTHVNMILPLLPKTPISTILSNAN